MLEVLDDDDDHRLQSYSKCDTILGDVTGIFHHLFAW